MNNNRCLYCNRIIPEGRHICPKCEKKLSQDGISRSITSVYGVTPENKFCLACKMKECDGECERFKKYTQRRKLHKKQQNKDI